MGSAISFTPKFQTLTALFPITTTTILVLITPLNGAVHPFATFKHDTFDTSSSSGHSINNNSAQFRHVLLVVLAVTFTLLFLLLLYLKHCRKSGNSVNANTNSQTSQRKHSGIDNNVLDSIPLFTFSSLKGEKNGLECAVCLTKFEDPEILRLLPKCKHAFHTECLDTWLDTHSTCPLCRTKVDPNDAIVIDDENAWDEDESDIESGRHDDVSSQGRQSQVGTVTSLDGVEHRIEHRIIVSPNRLDSRERVNQRWNDFQRDVLYLTSDVITWKARGGRARMSENINKSNIVDINCLDDLNNLRSVSDATGMTSGQTELHH